MKQKSKVLLKDTIIFAIGNIGARLVFFFLVPLYTNFLSQEEYGISELVITISELVIPIATLTIHDAILRFGLSKNEKKEHVIKNGLLVWLLGSAALAVALPLFSLYAAIAPWSLFLYTYIVFKGLFLIEMNYLKVRNYNKIFAFLSIIQAILLCIFNIIFLIIFQLGIKGYLYASIISIIISDILAIVFSKTIISMKTGIISKKLIHNMLSFSIPMIFTNISWWIINSSDKIMVEAMIGVAAVGLYTVAAKIPSLINVLVNIFSQAWGISSVKEYEGSNDNKFYSDIFEKYSFIVFAVCIVVVSIIKPFMIIYVGSDFIEAWKYVPLLLVSATFSAVGGFFATLSSTIKKTTINMITTLVGAGLNIFINLFLIPIIGIWGAIIGTIISYFIVNISRVWIVRKYIKVDINKLKLILNILLVVTHSVIVSLDCHVYVVSFMAVVIFIIINLSSVKGIINLFKTKLKKKH